MQRAALSLSSNKKNFKEAIDTDNTFGALLTDLSKAFDSLDHSLLVANLQWHGLSP